MWGLFSRKKDIAESLAVAAGEPVAGASLLNAAGKSGRSVKVRNALTEVETHLFGWLLDATPEEISRTSKHQNMVLSELGKRLKNRTLQDFPRKPIALPHMLKTLADDNPDSDQLTRVIQGHPALTNHLIHLSNSPYFTRAETTVESVKDAIATLGQSAMHCAIAAALLRPAMVARGSREALFAQRLWRWGITCSKAAELIARIQGRDTMAYAIVGLLPALSYLVVRREIVRIYRSLLPDVEPEISVLCTALRSPEWTIAQLIAEEWDLPPRYHAHLMAAQRPAPNSSEAPLNDGMVIATHEVLRQAHRNALSDDILAEAVLLSDQKTQLIRKSVQDMLRDKPLRGS